MIQFYGMDYVISAGCLKNDRTYNLCPGVLWRRLCNRNSDHIHTDKESYGDGETTETTENLKGIHNFIDGMAEKEEVGSRRGLPKWLMQGVFYGIFLALIGYTCGGMAMNAVPGLFMPGFDIVVGTTGFLSSIGIAYTKDISE